MTPGMEQALASGYDQALARIPEALKTEGFGVLTEIDVADMLGVDFRRYRILGVCNPLLAHEALQARLDVGVMLPCNVIVYEGHDGRAVVVAVDPMETAAARQDPRIRELAEVVRNKLQRVLAQLE